MRSNKIGKTTERALRKEAQKELVIEARLAGYTMREIAKRAGCSPKTVIRIVEAEIAEFRANHQAKIADVVTTQAAILERMRRTFWRQTMGTSGDNPKPANIKAAKLLLQIMQRQSKLLGLDVMPDDDREKGSLTVTVINGLDHSTPPDNESVATEAEAPAIKNGG